MIPYIKKNNDQYIDSKVDEILSKIQTNNFIAVDGIAGTGKTSLAKCLLEKINNALFIIFSKNYVFEYLSNLKAKNISVNFSLLDWKNGNKDITKYSYLVIDEAQRLNNEDINFINNLKNIKVILFQDPTQFVNDKNDVGPVNVDTTIKLTKTLRFSNEDYSRLEYLFFRSDTIPFYITTNLKINIFDSTKDILYDYINLKLCSTDVSCFTSTTNTRNDFIISSNLISLSSAQHGDRYRYYLESINQNINKYYYIYDLLSKEVDAIYIYINSSFKFINNKITVVNVDKHSEQFILNQLFALATRAKKTINVYIGDVELRNAFKKRLNEINYYHWYRQIKH